jgi:hypothetical protein
MKELLLEIVKEAGYQEPRNLKGITIEMIIDGSLQGNIVTYIRELTGCAKATVSSCIAKAFPDRDPIHDRSIKKFLLSKRELRWCSKCSTIKHENEFYYNESKQDGLSDLCKECNKQSRIDCYNKNPQKEIMNNTIRKQAKENQTPKWVDEKELVDFYKNRPEGYHVDHIIPIKGKLVSGLHCIENLQYLPAKENLSKNNKYEP